MKQYTNTEQTSKLIELGFSRPKSISSIKVTGDIITTADDLIGEPSSVMGGKHIANYSIGELIEMLPKELEKHSWDFYSIDIYFDTFNWNVCYKNRKGQIAYQTSSIEELVNALFEMVVKLKEEGI